MALDGIRCGVPYSKLSERVREPILLYPGTGPCRVASCFGLFGLDPVRVKTGTAVYLILAGLLCDDNNNDDMIG